MGGGFHSGWVGLGHGKFAKLSGFLDEELFLSCSTCPFWVTGQMGGELNKGVFTSPCFLLTFSMLFLPGCDVMLGCLSSMCYLFRSPPWSPSAALGRCLPG